MPKNALFLLKNYKIAEHWGLATQTPGGLTTRPPCPL